MPPSIDWTRPWFASIKSVGEKIAAEVDWRAALNRHCSAMKLTNHRGLPLSFVDQAELPDHVAYEAFIGTTGCVPTRDNLHDFFNALVWLNFPNIKRQLNALQAKHIDQHGISRQRGAVRDAATIFDESAALLVVADDTEGHALAAALRAHQWHDVFVEQRDSFNQRAEVWLFGHALMERLAQPYKSITAHAWVVLAPQAFFSLTHEARREWLDTRVAGDLSACEVKGLSTACFTPLPVLGIPGWWPLQNREFYDDAKVFRAKRKRS